MASHFPGILGSPFFRSSLGAAALARRGRHRLQLRCQRLRTSGRVEEGIGADWGHGIQDWELGTGWDVEVLPTPIWGHT